MGREAHERDKACGSRVEEEIRRARMLVYGLCRQQVLLGKDRGSLAASMDFDRLIGTTEVYANGGPYVPSVRGKGSDHLLGTGT